MFGKEKTREEEVMTQTTRPSSSSSKEVSTLIGEGCKVEGNFFVPTTTRIDGIIKGDLTGEVGLIIGSKGLVEGNVCAAEVTVFGNVKGNIEADKLELKRGSMIDGDIMVNYLHTEVGAQFNGRCAMKPAERNVTELTSAEA